MGDFRLLGVFADLNFVGQSFESPRQISLFFRRHVIDNVVICFQTMDFGSRLDIHHSVTSALPSYSHLTSYWRRDDQILAQVYQAYIYQALARPLRFKENDGVTRRRYDSSSYIRLSFAEERST